MRRLKVLLALLAVLGGCPAAPTGQIDSVKMPLEPVESGSLFSASISWASQSRRELTVAAKSTGCTAQLAEPTWLDPAEVGASREIKLTVTRTAPEMTTCEVRFVAFTNDALGSVRVK